MNFRQREEGDLKQRREDPYQISDDAFVEAQARVPLKYLTRLGFGIEEAVAHRTHTLRAIYENAVLEVVDEASVIEIDRADDGALSVSNEDLFVNEAGGILEDTDARLGEIRVGVFRHYLDELFICRGRGYNADVDSPSDSALKRLGHFIINDEIRGGDIEILI